MRKLFSIFFIAALLFNLVGYRLVFSGLEQRSDEQLTEAFDNNGFSEQELISIKLPLTHLSYYNCSTKFERIDGQVQVAGVTYKYVKRRLCNDSLEVLCIRDEAATQLKNASNDFFKVTNGLTSSTQERKADAHKTYNKNISTDSYLVNKFFGSQIPQTNNPNQFSNYIVTLPFSFSPVYERPPIVQC